MEVRENPFGIPLEMYREILSKVQDLDRQYSVLVSKDWSVATISEFKNLLLLKVHALYQSLQFNYLQSGFDSVQNSINLIEIKENAKTVLNGLITRLRGSPKGIYRSLLDSEVQTVKFSSVFENLNEYVLLSENLDRILRTDDPLLRQDLLVELVDQLIENEKLGQACKASLELPNPLRNRNLVRIEDRCLYTKQLEKGKEVLEEITDPVERNKQVRKFKNFCLAYKELRIALQGVMIHTQGVTQDRLLSNIAAGYFNGGEFQKGIDVIRRMTTNKKDEFVYRRTQQCIVHWRLAEAFMLIKEHSPGQQKDHLLSHIIELYDSLARSCEGNHIKQSYLNQIAEVADYLHYGQFQDNFDLTHMTIRARNEFLYQHALSSLQYGRPATALMLIKKHSHSHVKNNLLPYIIQACEYIATNSEDPRIKQECYNTISEAYEELA